MRVNRRILCSGLIGLFWLSSVAALPAEPVAETTMASATKEDECSGVVVARLGRQPVYLNDLWMVTKRQEESLVLLQPDASRWETIREIRKRELDRIITKRLYSLAAIADTSVQPTTEEIEQQYANLVQRFGSEESLLQFQGLSGDDVRNLLTLSIAADRLQKKHVIDKIKVTSKIKEEYYSKHLKDRFTIPPQAAVRGLFRFVDDETESASEEQKIRHVRTELEEALKGVTDKQQRLAVLSGFVKAYSEHQPTRYSGGLWYIYGGHNIEQKFWKFEDAAFKEPPNQLSDVIPIDDGYCIFIVDSKRPEHVKSYSEAEREIERMIRTEQFEFLQQQWLDSLRQKYKVEIFEDDLMCGVVKDSTPEQ